MIEDITARSIRVSGSPYETGRQLGLAVRGRIPANIERYLEAITARYGDLDRDRLKLRRNAWFNDLPPRFREELQGLAEGAGIPLELIIDYYVADVMLAESGCSGIICMVGDKVWLGRNNDWLAPELWGYATVREIEGRIPTLTFGMQGDIFSVTGINRERLWLHHNYLPADDLPSPRKPSLDYFVWITEALETCRTVADVRDLLDTTDRTGGMMLFAVDGKTNQFAIYECACSRYRARMNARSLTGTNHYISGLYKQEHDDAYRRSVSRLEHLDRLAEEVIYGDTGADLPDGLIKILGDAGVEQRGDPYWTVYSAAVCPSDGDIRFTFGGYPAASRGNWQKVPWPWD